MEDDSKTYTDCILALRKYAVDNAEIKKSHCALRKATASLRSESLDENALLQQDARYLPKNLQESFSPKPKKMYKAHLHQVKICQGPTRLSWKFTSLPCQNGATSKVNLVDIETAVV